MNIKIDVREKDLIKLMGPLQTDLGLKANIEILTLPLGDVIIESDKEDLLIIERKKLTDLAGSIKDGRYEEQAYRLANNEFPNHHVMYIMEGNMDQYREKYTRIPKKSLYSAMFCLNYYEGFSLMRTNNTVETAEFILRMVDKLRRDKKKYGRYHKNFVQEKKDYVDVVKKVKKANITPKNIGEIMLSQIPGISTQSAKAIMMNYKTVKGLLDAVSLDNSCLDGVTYETSKGKKRHISRTAIKNLIEYLW